ncbi:MAG: glycosyltransferase family 2 protein [Hyphomicrobiales bacterium]
MEKLNNKMDISVIIPLLDEEESLPELNAWISKVMKSNNFSYEVIYVDDGSKDKSWKIISDLSNEMDEVKGIRFKRNYGKSAALNKGFEMCSGDVVITMDADLQDSPDEIPELYRLIAKEGYDLISGWKKKRYDPLMKTLPSKFFNWTTRKMSGIKLNDFNCGLKAYKKDVVKNIEIYGEMHRYIPVIAKFSGFPVIGEKVVQHRERKYGITKFGLDRFVKGYLDLISINFMMKFGKRPMHFFGSMGSVIFLIGFVIGIYLTIDKLFFDAYRIAERPLFFLGILAMILGSQLFLTGFLAEMISRNSSDRNKYLISEFRNLDKQDK